MPQEKEHLILKTQANKLFQTIKQLGLDPLEFEWRREKNIPEGTLIVSVLVHKPTEYYFHFGFLRGQEWCQRSPGPDRSVDERYGSAWDSQEAHAHEWLSCLKREIETPDLWESVSQEKALVEAASAEGLSNTPFIEAEQQDISAKLDEIQQFLLAAHQFEESQKEFVRSRLDYLKDAAERMGRKDWLNLTTGTLLGIVVQTGLNSDAARELFRLAGNLLQSLFAGGMPPLLP